MNLQKTIIVLVALAALSLQACSTAKVRVMPGEKGINKVIARDIEQDDAEEAALDGAKEYCADQDKRMVVLKEGTKYTGEMDESTRKTVRNASKTATWMGGAVLGRAGMAGTSMTSDRDYKSVLLFKCKS